MCVLLMKTYEPKFMLTVNAIYHLSPLPLIYVMFVSHRLFVFMPNIKLDDLAGFCSPHVGMAYASCSAPMFT